MVSPICQVKDGAGSFVDTLNGVNVTPGNTITIKLFDTSGVVTWVPTLLGTDEASTAFVSSFSNAQALPTSVINVNTTAGFNSSGTIFIKELGATITYTGKNGTQFTGCSGGSGTLATNYTVQSVILSVNNITKQATFVAPAAGSALIFQSQVNGGVDFNGVPQPSYTTTFGVFTLTTTSLRVGAVGEKTEGDAAFGWISKYNNLIRTFTATTASAGAGLTGFYNVGQNADNTIKVNADDIQLNPAFYSTAAVANTLVQRNASNAIIVGQANVTSLNDSGNATVGGTLGVTGTSTLGIVGCGALTATSLNTGGTLSAGSSTLASLVVTNSATVGTTLGVTGAITAGSTLAVTTSVSSPAYTFTGSQGGINRISAITPQADPANWKGGTAGFWTNLSLGTKVICNIDPPQNCVINTITVRFQGAGSHAGLPATMPLVELRHYDTSSNLDLTDGSQSDTSANTSAFQTLHSITISGLNVTVDKRTLRYHVDITAESGANALVGATVTSVQYTFTRSAGSSVGLD